MSQYLLLENMKDSDELEFAVSEFWFIDCFFIVLSDAKYKYIPLTYPIYKLDKNTGIVENGLWTPPYVALKYSSNLRRFRTVLQIKNLLQKAYQENEEKIQESFEYFFYYLGISQYDLETIDSFTEYKPSFSENGKHKCYRITNHLVRGIDTPGLVNLIDPECLRNLQFMNLDFDLQRLSSNSDVNPVYFKGKVLATNLARVLKEHHSVFFENANTNYIDLKKLVYNETGYLFTYDINSSGEIRNNIENSFHSLSESGDKIATDFLDSLYMIFNHAFEKYNIGQFRLEGDGFIASIPQRNFHVFYGTSTPSEPLRNIKMICEEIDSDINEMLQFSDIKVTSKTTIYYGAYQYGKNGGIGAYFPSYSGKSLFTLARIQEGLSDWIKTISVNRSYFASANMDTPVMEQNGFTYLCSRSVQIKESEIQLSIYF